MPVKCGSLPAQEYLLALFSYNKQTGILTRLATGKPILGARKSKYIVVGIDRKTYLAHRIIWKMVTGEEPTNLVDHRDCDGFNNKWDNLRDAEQKENLCNRGAPKSNTSGVKGVSFCRSTGLWRASITVDYRCINLGRYPSIQEAAKVRMMASEKMHGDFARAA